MNKAQSQNIREKCAKLNNCHQQIERGCTKMEISFEEFPKLDLRIGKILEANQIPGSRNLIRMTVDFGTEKKQAVAGLLQYYKPESMVGRKYAFILNLQKRKRMGVESQCMILAAEDNGGNVVVLQPE